MAVRKYGVRGEGSERTECEVPHNSNGGRMQLTVVHVVRWHERVVDGDDVDVLVVLGSSHDQPFQDNKQRPEEGQLSMTARQREAQQQLQSTDVRSQERNLAAPVYKHSPTLHPRLQPTEPCTDSEQKVGLALRKASARTCRARHFEQQRHGRTILATPRYSLCLFLSLSPQTGAIAISRTFRCGRSH